MQGFSLFLFLQMLYMFQAVPPPIIRSTHNCTYRFRYCQPILLLAAIVDGRERSSLSSTIAASSSMGWQYLKLYVQLCVLLMMGGGTAWNMYSICRNKKNWETLHPVGYNLEIYSRCTDILRSNVKNRESWLERLSRRKDSVSANKIYSSTTRS